MLNSALPATFQLYGGVLKGEPLTVNSKIPEYMARLTAEQWERQLGQLGGKLCTNRKNHVMDENDDQQVDAGLLDDWQNC